MGTAQNKGFFFQICNGRDDTKFVAVHTRVLLVGLVPRVCEELFREMEVRKKGNKGVTYEVCLSIFFASMTAPYTSVSSIYILCDFVTIT